MFPTLHPAHARLEAGSSCPLSEPFSARGSLAQTATSQRLVEAIRLIGVTYRSGPPQKQGEFWPCPMHAMGQSDQASESLASCGGSSPDPSQLLCFQPGYRGRLRRIQPASVAQDSQPTDDAPAYAFLLGLCILPPAEDVWACAAILIMAPGHVGHAFQPAGEWGFPAPRLPPGDWKVARTGRLESLPYVIMRIAGARAGARPPVRVAGPSQRKPPSGHPKAC